MIALRPLGLSEILDGAFTYIRRSPGIVLGISAVIAVASNIVQFVFSLLLFTGSSTSSLLFDQNANVNDLLPLYGQILGGSLVTTTITLIFQVIGTGMLTVIITRAVLGQDIGWSEAWSRSRGLILPLFGLTIITSVLSFFGLLLCLVPGIFLYVSWALAVPALMVERCGIREAMRRSWRLVTGSRWRVLGIIVLAQIIASLVAQIVAVPFAFVGLAIDGLGGGLTNGSIPFATLVASAIGGVIATTITLPFTAGVVALIYVDQRMRREGLDLQLAQAAAPATNTAGGPGSTPNHPGPPGAPDPSNAPSPWTSG